MSSSQSPSGNSGSFSVGLSTARFLDQAMLDDATPAAVPTVAPAAAPASRSVPTTRLSPPPAPSTPAERAGSEEEISDYMNQLLKRNGQAKSGSAPAAPAVSNPVPETAPAQPLEEELPWTEAQYIPKKLAPEREADLRAFRQLANASARGALNSFQQKKQRSHCTTSGIVATISLVAAVPLFLHGSQVGDRWYLGALAALVSAGVFGYRFQKSRSSLGK
jgi:hypothetical protein